MVSCTLHLKCLVSQQYRLNQTNQDTVVQWAFGHKKSYSCWCL